MKLNAIDFIGKEFGRLTVISEHSRNHKNHIIFLCKCSCGNFKNVNVHKLKSGTKSCGCLTREILFSNNIKHGHCVNGRASPEYRCYHKMIKRCYDSNDKEFHCYGGRGITVCDRWRSSFENFYEDMGDRPSIKHSIDRMNVNGNYEKENCRWATSYQQFRNKTNNVWLEYEGEKMILSDWAIKLNIDKTRFHAQLKRTSFSDFMDNYNKYGLIDRRTLPNVFYKNPARFFLGKKGKDNPKSIKINQLDKHGNFIQEFDSIALAKEETGIHNIHIPLRDSKRTAGGYRWEYAK